MIRDWNDFDRALRDIALIDIDVTEAGRARGLALISAETQYEQDTKTRLAARASKVKDLEKFYRQHRKEVEAAGKKSKDLNFGRAGLRTGAKKLALMKGFKWPEVLAAVKENFTDWTKFVRVKESLKKDVMKSDLGTEALEALGVTVKQPEEFWIETFPEKAVSEAA